MKLGISQQIKIKFNLFLFFNKHFGSKKIVLPNKTMKKLLFLILFGGFCTGLFGESRTAQLPDATLQTDTVFVVINSKLPNPNSLLREIDASLRGVSLSLDIRYSFVDGENPGQYYQVNIGSAVPRPVVERITRFFANKSVDIRKNMQDAPNTIFIGKKPDF